MSLALLFIALICWVEGGRRGQARSELRKVYGTGCCVCYLLKIGQRLKASKEWSFILKRRNDFRKGFIDTGTGEGLKKFCISSILILTHFSVFFLLEPFSCCGVGGSQ